MTAISRSKTTIYIAPVGTAMADLASTTYEVAGEIKSYSKSGGEKDVESDAVFGGYVDKEKPTSQFEVEMEVVPKVNTDQMRWNDFVYAKDTANTNIDIYTSAQETSTQPSDRMIAIEATDGTNYSSLVFNNCNSVMLDVEHNADDNQTGTINFKFSPTDDSGVANLITAATDISSLPDFSDLDNN